MQKSSTEAIRNPDNRVVIKVQSGTASVVHAPNATLVTIVDLDSLPEQAAHNNTETELETLKENLQYLENNGPFSQEAAQQVALLLEPILGGEPSRKS